jgi:hypothetical protein
MAATPATSLTLISSGLQDARLQPPRGNPDINQFIKVLRKTTRWAAQWNRIDFDGSPEFGTRVSMTLPVIGELITNYTLVVTMPDIYSWQLEAILAAGGTSFQNRGRFLGPTYGWTNSLGHALIQQIELEIGGAIVQTLDGRLLEILDELYESVEGAISKNAMIKRAPSGFSPQTWLTPEPLTVQIPIPFWFSRRGISSHALPIEALKQDRVRVHVTFRPINQLFYTDARVDPRTVGYRGEAIDGLSGELWELTGGRFWQSNPTATGRVYSMNASMPAAGCPGELLEGYVMPLRFTPVDAYALVEYISLEEYEALALRSSELTYHVEQYLAVPQQTTQNSTEIRMLVPYSNPTKELLWVAQRPEAETYNAWFLFTRDLGPVVPPQAGPANPCRIPWWPDAVLIPSATSDWQIVPAFQTSYSEPFTAASLLYNSYERFIHDGPSMFRSVVPALYYTKSAVHDRYVYAYKFGQKEVRGEYGPKGAANWDKIPRKELFFTMARGRNGIKPPSMNIYVYVTIWNVFKVFGGRGGMLFNN